MSVSVHAAGSGVEFFSDATIQDPYPYYARMRERGPVQEVAGSGFYAVCSWDAINEVIARPDDFSSNLTATMTYTPENGVGAFEMEGLGGSSHVLATADDPIHAVHRKMLVPQLAAKRIRATERFVGEAALKLWRGGERDGLIEWMSAMANRLPMMVVARLIGVPDDDVDMLIKSGYATTQLLDGLIDADGLAVAGTAAIELSGYISEYFARAATDPGDNLLGDLAAACASGALDDNSARVIMLTLFSAGGESTASLLGSATWILATHPDIQRQLRADPILLGAFIEESLRFEPPFRGHYRHVVNDTALGGVELPAGSRLFLLWGAANRDPAQFESPDEFRLDRSKGKGHITFGKGAHFCVGAALARLEARLVLEMLLEQTEWIEAGAVGRWLPSILVRRLERLELTVK
ncbi:cytochrome P450 [Mycolicibacterium rhodesiae NBB3]|jgi:cytochrome P450|uniref:Cytochrome P450 n=1 Tax=Mycolicibacterium rhodesiae (strain NBB3) TaxID=710685 RepID=G8RGH3_MYCRN|nr:cytochrome P450 [Mycolicibacterium rhodesiae]AEV70742.1 cytochrome P450 [Mycolicibacterium rhodesiae NBB3]